jgi:hypothetical protein
MNVFAIFGCKIYCKGALFMAEKRIWFSALETGTKFLPKRKESGVRSLETGVGQPLSPHF